MVFIFLGKEATLLSVLSNMFYGFISVPEHQFKTYCTMLQLAARSGLVKLMITDLNRVKEWFEEWKLSVEDRRACLRFLHSALSIVRLHG